MPTSDLVLLYFSFYVDGELRKKFEAVLKCRSIFLSENW